MSKNKYTVTDADIQHIQDKIAKARQAMAQISDWNQQQVDRLAQSIAWHTSNKNTFTRLAQMGVDESGIGDRQGRPNKRFKIHGILRDVLRQKSVGIVEQDPKKGLVKYAKPVGVIAALVPMTNPALTPPGTAINASKGKNAVIFTPHPRTQKTTAQMVAVIRKACEIVDAPADLFQVIENPSIPLTNTLMAECDLTMATGGMAMVKAAYSSGKPAYGVGAGNATMVVDATADLKQTAKNIRISKTSDFGSGCSADGNIIIQKSIYKHLIQNLIDEGGYLCNAQQKKMIAQVMWDENGNRTFETIACCPQQMAVVAGFKIPEDRKFLMVLNDGKIGKQHKFSTEKLTTLMALYTFESFDDALDIVKQIYAVGGMGHSCGIHSHNDAHIDALARVAPVSRMMVNQAQSKANAGAWDNGMPMTSNLGCGVWGGNIINENVNLTHYLQYTWVSRTIAPDRPSEQDLFGEFYQTATF